MPLSRDQINAKFAEALGMATPETHARVSAIFEELSGEFDAILTESETATTEMQRLTKDNETLRQVNTKLFLKVGTPAEKEKPPVDEPTEQPPSETLTYEKLFNEKGELI